MPAKASLAVEIPVNDEGIQKFIDGLKTLLELGGVKVPAAFAEGSNKIVTEFGKIAAKAEQISKETAAKAELIEKASAAKISEMKVAAGLKEEARQKAQSAKEEQDHASRAAKESQSQSARESKVQQAQARQSAKFEEGEKRKASAAGNADKAIQAATERRVKFEEQAEKMKYEDAKEKYKELVTAHQNMTTAMQEAATKEDKAELASKLAELKAEKQAYADNIRERPQTKKGESSDVGMHGTGRETTGFSGGALMEVAGIGAAIEGLSSLVEKSHEVAEAQHQLQAGTGLAGEALEKAGKQAEELGDKLGIPGSQAKETMGKIAGLTHASGADLQKMTEAAIAYEQVTGRSAAKMMKTAKGREEIMVNAEVNIAKAQLAAQDPAKQAELAQKQLEETGGELASTLLTGLQPAIKALTPILREIGQLVGGVLKPVFAALAPILTFVGNALGVVVKFLADNKDTVLVFAGAIGAVVLAIKGWEMAQEALNLVMEANPIGLAVVALAAFAAGIVYLYENVKPVRDLLDATWDSIKAGGAAIWAFIQNYVSSLIKAFEGVGKVLTSLIHLDFKGMVDGAKQVGASVVDAYAGSAKKAGAAFGTSMSDSMAEHASDAVKENVKKTLEQIDKGLASAGLTPASKAALEKSRQQWVEYGKKVGADVGEAVAGGMSVADSGSAPGEEKAKGAGKARKTAIQKAEDEAHLQHAKELAAITAQIDELSDEEVKAKKTKAEESFQANMLVIKKKFGEKSGQVAEEIAQEELRVATEASDKQAALDAKTEADQAKVLANIKAQKDKQLAEDKSAAELDAKNALEITKQQNANLIDAHKLLGLDTTELEKQQAVNDKAIIEQDYADKLSKYDESSDMYLALVKERNTKEAAVDDAFNKVQDDKTAAAEKKKQDAQIATANYFMGPVMQGMQKGFSMMFAGINAMTQKWTESKNAAVSVFGTIAAGFIQMIESMIVKLAAVEAMTIAIDLIPGGSGVLSLLSIGSKLADGGIMTRPTMLGAGIMTQPTFLASGGVMPFIGGEAGDEAVIPLHNSKYPGIGEMASGGLAGSIANSLAPHFASLNNSVQQMKITTPINTNFQQAVNRYQFVVGQTTRS